MMNSINPTRWIASTILMASLPGAGVDPAQATDAVSSLVGTWTLVVADVVHADGTRGHDYGDKPKGLLVIDAAGRYSLQIFSDERIKFASADKKNGTEAEYRSAVIGVSAHFGTVKVDAPSHALIFNIEASSFPNLDGAEQKRSYELTRNELSYRVPPRPNGDVPLSIWRRVK